MLHTLRMLPTMLPVSHLTTLLMAPTQAPADGLMFGGAQHAN